MYFKVAQAVTVRFVFIFFAPVRRIEVPESSLNVNERVFRISRGSPRPLTHTRALCAGKGPTLANYSYAARPQEDAPACLNLPYSKIKALPKLLGRRAPAPERALK